MSLFRLKSILTCSVLILLSSLGFGGINENIDVIIELYAKEPSAAVTQLNNLYLKNANQYYLIIQTLKNKQQYDLLLNFLSTIPANKRTASDLLETTFLTGKQDYLLPAIQSYLKYENPENTARIYGRFFIEQPTALYLSQYLTNQSIFFLLSRSHILYGMYENFDLLLLSNRTLLNNSYPEWVTDYIARSWEKRPRRLTELLTAYGLDKQPASAGMLLYADFQDGRFAQVIDQYQHNTSLYQEKLLRSQTIDLSYFLAYSYFRLGNYTQSLTYLRQVYFPWNHDLADLYFRNYLGLNKYTEAAKFLPSLKNGDARQFYSAYLDLLNMNTNSATRQFESYMEDITDEHHFRLETTLLLFTLYKNPADLPVVTEAVKNSLLYRDVTDNGKIPLLSAYAGQKNSIPPSVPTGSETIDQFHRYRQALLWLKEGKTEEAKSVFMELIQSDKTSPLIKSLSIYQIRRIS